MRKVSLGVSTSVLSILFMHSDWVAICTVCMLKHRYKNEYERKNSY